MQNKENVGKLQFRKATFKTKKITSNQLIKTKIINIFSHHLVKSN